VSVSDLYFYTDTKMKTTIPGWLNVKEYCDKYWHNYWRVISRLPRGYSLKKAVTKKDYRKYNWINARKYFIGGIALMEYCKKHKIRYHTVCRFVYEWYDLKSAIEKTKIKKDLYYNINYATSTNKS